MKKVLLSILTIALLISCRKYNNDIELSQEVSANKAASSTSSASDYNVAVSVSTDGTEWTYNITRAKLSAKNLSHFIIDLNNCGDSSVTFGDIVSATVNGQPANLEPNEGWGTGCNPQSTTTNFVKFNTLPAATSWILVMKLDRGYDQYQTATAWIKAGTSCNQIQTIAPGCPIQKRCSYSQGYFFANGALINGSTDYWTNGLTIGGVTYTQAQGFQIWNTNKGRGSSQAVNAFFQLGALRLSGVDSELPTEARLIDTYFNGINLISRITYNSSNGGYYYFNIPASVTDTTIGQTITRQMVQNAGASIGSWIEANHCE